MWEWLRNMFCKEEEELLQFQINSLTDTIDKTSEENEKLKNKLEKLELKLEPDTSKIPNWIDPEKGNHNPSVLVFERGKSYWVQIGTKDIYNASPALEKFVDEKTWRGLPLNQKFREIWKHVIQHIKYRYDQSESWEYPTTTHYRKFGDCEDGTIYFVTLCKLAGVPANKVFNCIGKMGSIGHSWPIVRMEDNKWYIMETTIDSVPEHPMLFLGSRYKAVWGAYNHRFKGGINNAQKQV